MIQNQAFMKASQAFFQRTVKENGSILRSHIFSSKSAVSKVGSINQTTLLNQFNKYQTRLINNNGKKTESRWNQGKQFFSMFSFMNKSRVNWNSVSGYHRSGFSPNTHRNFSYESEHSSRPPFSGVLKVWAATAVITGACGLLTLTKYEPLEKLKHEWDRNYQKRKRQALREETWYSYWYYTTTDTQKVQFALIALNAIVFGMWQRSGGYFMYRYFAHSAYDSRVLPAFLSFFSHQSIGHFAFNMIAFYSFSSSIGAVLGAEHILAMYLAGGMFSSAASHTFKFLFRDAAPSLGASGAVSAMILAHGYLFPQSIMSIIFLPFVSFTAGKFIPVWLGIECAGVIAKVMGWFRSSFDHTAHLAGALFGYLYIQSWIEVQRARRRSIKRDFR